MLRMVCKNDLKVDSYSMLKQQKSIKPDLKTRPCEFIIFRNMTKHVER